MFVSLFKRSDVIKNILIGFLVSLVMLNLAIAMGFLSGRGVFAGVISAAIIAFITSAFGGTRIQGSGPTAPMGALTAVIIAFAYETIPAKGLNISPDQFMNLVILMTSGLLVLFAYLRLGKVITYIPQLVVSGFMCGISIIIWTLQFNLLFGIGRAPLEGDQTLNIAIAGLTLVGLFIVPSVMKKIPGKASKVIPSSLIVLLIISIISAVFIMPVEYLTIDNPIGSWGGLGAYIGSQVPTEITLSILLLALPHAIKLALLCAIDTLLTSLIVDRLCGTTTRRSKELTAQGFANGLVAMFGGVPGAQSTVPSVLTVKEGATSRVCGISAGFFILMFLFLFGGVLSYIPVAAFCGILIKVGYDVFDIKPVLAYFRTLRRQLENRQTFILRHREMFILTGTALTTAFVDMIVAVVVFTIGLQLVNNFSNKTVVKDVVPR